jgi:DNA-binding CsgD family transcriptional regulator
MKMVLTQKKSALSQTENGFAAISIPGKLQRAAKRFDLTNREVQVIFLLGSGDTFKAAGERLHISARTVQFHAINLRRKIHAANCLAALTRLVL